MKRSYKRRWYVGWFFVFLVVVAASAAVVMLLWNALIPEIIGWSTITYWKALGLIILSRFLLGGLGRQPFWHHNGFGHEHPHTHFMRHRHMRKKMKGMSRKDRRDYICKCMSGEIDPMQEECKSEKEQE